MEDNKKSKNNNSRIENSLRNIFSGIFLSIFVTIMPFVIRTIMTYTIGIEYLGLNNFFMSVVQILNMSEMGIGSVMVYFLYAPAAVGDKEKINAYMNALHKIYFFIGIIMLMAGLIFMPFTKAFISGDIPAHSNIELWFFLYLFGTVLQYFLFPEQVTLLEAFQRKDIVNRISFIANGISYVIQIVALLLFHSYFVYLVSIVIQCFITGLLRKYYGLRYFREYKSEGLLSLKEKKSIQARVLSMIGHQMDEKLFNSIDTVIISSVLGLSAVAIYSNYFYVITSVAMLFSMIYTAILSSIGNAVAVESSDDNYGRFMNMFWIGTLITGIATVFMLCLYQNFMYLWMGTENMLGIDMVILFCIYFYLSEIRWTVVTFKNAAGMWWNDRYKPYISMAIDLILDLILIRYIGVMGAIISSIVCLGFIEIPWETKVLFRDYFHKPVRNYLSKMLRYSLVNFGVIFIAYLLCDNFTSNTGVISLVLKILICCCSILVYVVFYWKSEECHVWRGIFSGIRSKK